MIGSKPRRLAVVVLAAGAGSRFGGGKLVAALEGRPILQHVLDAIAGAPLREVVVVTRPDAGPVEQAIAWRAERRVPNPKPEDGLASSLKVGLAALDVEVEGALVVLGDQPRIRSIVIRRIADAWRGSGGPIVAARYSRDGAPNPVLLDRSVWPLAFSLTGDRGMAQVLRGKPGLVRWVDVAGVNPDVDTKADLEQLAGDGST